MGEGTISLVLPYCKQRKLFWSYLIIFGSHRQKFKPSLFRFPDKKWGNFNLPQTPAKAIDERTTPSIQNPTDPWLHSGRHHSTYQMSRFGQLRNYEEGHIGLNRKEKSCKNISTPIIKKHTMRGNIYLGLHLCKSRHRNENWIETLSTLGLHAVSTYNILIITLFVLAFLIQVVLDWRWINFSFTNLLLIK